ncbi:MAG: glycosyltransferase [Actinobacteria bacterium]|nr:MAG: glycosyltransferase [Actinomycetota bacterium]
MRSRASTGPSRARRQGDPRRARRGVRPRRDGSARADVRRARSRPRRRHRPVPPCHPRVGRYRVVSPLVSVLKTLFWGSLGALAWTHLGYPATAAAVARLRPRPVRKDDSYLPDVDVIVAAHNEEAVIERRLDNLLGLDYPPEKLRILVASDASDDRTDEIVEAASAREPRVRLLACPRGGKVVAQNAGVRDTDGAVVAFTDANAAWAADALRRLVSNLADPDVGYVCGQLRLEAADGSNQEGLYWRYEVWLREQESVSGSVTGGYGSIYALPRGDYVDTISRSPT